MKAQCGIGKGMRVKAAVVVGIFFLMGCAPTISQIHNFEPKKTLTSSKPPEQLANCVLYEAKNYRNIGWGVPNMTLINREGVYYITLESAPGALVGEVRFISTPEGGSLVEYRAPNVGSHLSGFIWEYVEKCAR
jgi:hypothetical protein